MNKLVDSFWKIQNITSSHLSEFEPQIRNYCLAGNEFNAVNFREISVLI